MDKYAYYVLSCILYIELLCFLHFNPSHYEFANFLVVHALFISSHLDKLQSWMLPLANSLDVALGGNDIRSIAWNGTIYKIHQWKISALNVCNYKVQLDESMRSWMTATCYTNKSLFQAQNYCILAFLGRNHTYSSFNFKTLSLLVNILHSMCNCLFFPHLKFFHGILCIYVPTIKCISLISSLRRSKYRIL